MSSTCTPDLATTDSPRTAPADAVLIVDGTFLQRPEIRDLWDERVWVDTAPEIARRRGVDRDADALGGKKAAERLFAKRYHAASQIYIDAVARPLSPRQSSSATGIQDAHG